MGGPATVPSFRAVFDAELTYVWNVLRRLGVPSADAEDVVHEVFLVVHRQLGVYDPSRPLRPWLFGICARKASDYRRLARHRREVAPSDREPIDEAPGGEEQLAQRQVQRQVSAALDALDFDQRAVLVMHDMEEHPMPVVAEALAIPLNTGYSRLRLARKAFAQAIARLEKRQESR